MHMIEVESYIKEHLEADFSHSVCPDCMKNLYPEYYTHMLMHLTKVYPFCIMASCEGQDSRERCRSFGGNSLPTLPAGSTWRKADGRMDLCVRTVAAGSIG